MSDRELYLLWAYGAHDGVVEADGQRSLAQHVAHGAVKVNLVRGSVRTVSAQAPLHGALMLVAYFGLLFPAMFVARYLKRSLAGAWFRVHVALVLCALLVMSLALALIVDAVSLSALLHAPHPVLASVTLAFTLLVQPLLGLIADRRWRAAMRRVRQVRPRSCPHPRVSRHLVRSLCSRARRGSRRCGTGCTGGLRVSSLCSVCCGLLASSVLCLSQRRPLLFAALVSVLLGIASLELGSAGARAWLYACVAALVLAYVTAIAVQERLVPRLACPHSHTPSLPHSLRC